MPEISVVLPVRNAAKTIARAVDSILKQSFADIELIVVDDGSEDATAEELRGVDDSRLVYVHQEHCGVASAANCGTKLAKAPLIARMDADDYSHPRRLERQFDFLHEHNFDVVGCQIQILNDQGAAVGTLQRYERWINERTRLPDQILAFRFVEFPLVNPTLLGKRSYFELGFATTTTPKTTI